MVDHRPSVERLESAHQFPGTYQIKAIGDAGEDFTSRVISAVLEELAAPEDLTHSVRTTQGGHHVAVTLDLRVQSAEQVRTIYNRIHELKGLILLL
jgi:putative lipoic acid-binding regulatory protein